jgi:WXG100 family type VII secretion target
MSELLVNFGQLQAAVDHIDTAISSLHSSLGDLQNEAKPLTATWSGSAQAAYQQRQQQWTTAAEDITNILLNIKTALQESTTDYIQTERANTNLFA